MKKIFFSISLVLMLSAATQAHALDYSPLEPLPGPQTVQNLNFAQFLNALFKLLLIAGSLLAVIILVASGISYIVAGAWGEVSAARKRMMASLWGLVILLGAWLMLYTINPTLLNFDLSSIGGGNPASNGSTPAANGSPAPMTGVQNGTFSGGTQTLAVQNEVCGSNTACTMLDKYILFDPKSSNDSARKQAVNAFIGWCTGGHEDNQTLETKNGVAKMFSGDSLGESGLLGMACVLQ